MYKGYEIINIPEMFVTTNPALLPKLQYVIGEFVFELMAREYFIFLLLLIIVFFLLDLVHGNYGNWSLSSACNVTCDEGFETWARNCNNPEPKFGGRNCSHLGEAIEYRPCQTTPCPGKQWL